MTPSIIPLQNSFLSKKKRLFAALISLFSLSFYCHAATLIEMRSPDGAISKFWISEKMARMSGDDSDGFMLVDFAQGKQYSIDHAEKLIVDVTAGMMEETPPTPESSAKPVQVSIEEVGAGDLVAGYKTVKYAVKADNVLCSYELLSKELSDNNDIKRLVTYMHQSSLADQPLGDVEPCFKAEQALEGKYATLGVPLRSIDANGVVVSETLSVKINVTAPANTFTFPAGYRQATLQELMQEQLPQQGQ